MRLEPVMTYRCTTRGPIEEGGPQGTQQIWEVAEATLEGDGIRAALAAPGADWMGGAGDGFWRPDVRVAFVCDDGAAVSLHYRGLVEQTDAFAASAAEGTVGPADGGRLEGVPDSYTLVPLDQSAPLARLIGAFAP